MHDYPSRFFFELSILCNVPQISIVHRAFTLQRHIYKNNRDMILLYVIEV